MTIIGVDPHPKSHTVVAIDDSGKVLDQLTLDNTDEGLKEFLSWGKGFSGRRYAIEGVGNPYILPWVERLLGEQEEVVGISPSLTSQYRSRRGRKKSDPIDAEQVAKVLLANPKLPLYRNIYHVQNLKLLTRSRERLVIYRKAERMAIEQLPTHQTTLKQTLQTLVEALDQAIGAVEKQIEEQIQAYCPVLLGQKKQQGVGLILAGVILAEVGDITRFASVHHFASYSGAAPIDHSSGQNQRVQVNTGGNRRLNWALHLIARYRLIHDPTTQAFYERKIAEGKSRKAVIRLIKTAIARQLYKVLKEVLPSSTSQAA